MGADAVALAAHAGLVLDEWQAADLALMMSVRPDDRWACFEFAEIVARQNGKGSILEARELAGLFLVGSDQTIIHSAHEAKTSKEAFHRVSTLIKNTPDLHRRVSNYYQSNENIAIHLKNGKRLRFVTRTKGGGRGFSGDLIIMDEAYELGSDQIAALLPVLSARTNGQLVYASSAGMEHSQHLHSVRRRALADSDESLGYCEYSPDTEAAGFDPGSDQAAADANPSLGIRITLETIDRERRIMTPEVFARERLTIFDPDRSGGTDWAVVSEGSWLSTTDGSSEIVSAVALAIDVNPARSLAVIGAAGRNGSGKLHGEVAESRPGTDWVVRRVVEMMAKSKDIKIVAVDPGGPAGSLIGPLIEAGVDVVKVSPQDHAQACGLMVDAVESDGFAHLGDDELSAAVRSATKKPVKDVWYWRRGDGKNAPDITALVAVTLALGQVASLPSTQKPVYAY